MAEGLKPGDRVIYYYWSQGKGWHRGNRQLKATVKKVGKQRVTIVIEATGQLKIVEPFNLVLDNEISE